MTMSGNVFNTFANPIAIQSRCQIPITAAMDPDNYRDTCGQIDQAGQAYVNHQDPTSQS